MTPDFQIIANSVDITAKINDRLIDLSVTDEAGMKADSIDIKLDDRVDDRGRTIALPADGAELRVSMGYKQSGITFMGAFTYDEITLEGPPQIMAIRGQSADMSGPIKEPKTRNWDKITVKDIVAKIAGEHGLKPVVDEAKGAFHYKTLAQTNESDLHLLTRLAKDHDAIAAIKDGKVLFTAKGTGKSASGQALPVRPIKPKDVSKWKVTLTSRDKYKSVIAYYQDKKKRKKLEVRVGEGEPIYRIRHVKPTKEEAEKAARSKLDDLKRGKDRLSITMPGDASILAEMQLEMTGFRDGVDGRWSILQVRHQQNSSGYSCQIEAEKPLKVNGSDQAS